jgi:hypothetical protein
MVRISRPFAKWFFALIGSEAKIFWFSKIAREKKTSLDRFKMLTRKSVALQKTTTMIEERERERQRERQRE